jgi:co-chaperonin GroES (HSP10)
MFPKMVKSRVLILPDEVAEKTDGGIFLPKLDDVTETDQQIYSHTGSGEVIAKSSQVTDMEVGDRVFFGQVVGAPIEFDGIKYLMMNDHDVQAVIG